MLPLNLNLPLKTVTDRVRSCQAVLWALETYGDRLVATLGESLSPLLDPDQSLPFATDLDLFRKQLLASRDALVATDRAYRDQRARESLARGRRNDRAKDVRRRVVDLRRAFAGLYPPEKLAELGFARRTPEAPAELLEQASHLADHLAAPDLDLSGARVGELRLDPAEILKLRDATSALRRALEDLASAVRRTEALKLAKDEALSAFNRWFLWIARTVESLCHLAGLDEIARRVRPSGRRPGLTEKRFEPPAAEAPEAGTGSGRDQPATEEIRSEERDRQPERPDRRRQAMHSQPAVHPPQLARSQSHEDRVEVDRNRVQQRREVERKHQQPEQTAATRRNPIQEQPRIQAVRHRPG